MLPPTNRRLCRWARYKLPPDLTDDQLRDWLNITLEGQQLQVAAAARDFLRKAFIRPFLRFLHRLP